MSFPTATEPNIPMRIITVTTCKGGTGKTSLVQNLAYELSSAGHKVLCVDFDPQSNLTIAYGVDPAVDRTTIYHALDDPALIVDAVISTPHADIVPAGLDLAFAEQRFSGAFDRNDRLRKALEPVAGAYDYVLIDTPPSLGFYAFNSLAVATDCIVPCQVQPFSFRMIAPTMKLIELVQSVNTRLRVLGIVLTMYDRRVTMTASVEDATRSTYGDLVCKTTIPTNIAISEAQLEGQAVGSFAPGSAGAQAYKQLAEELFNNGK